MIETIIKKYLEAVQPLPVGMVKRAGVGEYYLLEKTGGAEQNHIRTATIAVQSYADTKQRAAEMNEVIIDHMLAAVQLDEIASVELNSNYDFTDTSTKAQRYQAFFEITHY